MGTVQSIVHTSLTSTFSAVKLKLAMVEVWTPRKSASAANEDLFPKRSPIKYLPAHHCVTKNCSLSQTQGAAWIQFLTKLMRAKDDKKAVVAALREEDKMESQDGLGSISADMGNLNCCQYISGP